MIRHTTARVATGHLTRPRSTVPHPRPTGDLPSGAPMRTPPGASAFRGRFVAWRPPITAPRLDEPGARPAVYCTLTSSPPFSEPAAISMRRPLARSALGTLTLSTPLSNLAEMSSTSMSRGSVNERVKLP